VSPERAALPESRAETAAEAFPEKCNPNKGRAPLTEDQRKLAVRYMPLARSLARKGDHSRTIREELEAAAYMALVEAAQSYDPSRNVNFAVFAQYRIKGALRDHRRFLFHDCWNLEAMHLPSFLRLGSNDDPRGWVVGKEAVPPVGRDAELLEAVESVFRRLPPTHAKACRLIYIDGKSQDEAAQALGYSKSYMSRMHRDAIEWLRRDHRSALAG
jgi:RNA polymerase sigma factor (sigma-70 family)